MLRAERLILQMFVLMIAEIFVLARSWIATFVLVRSWIAIFVLVRSWIATCAVMDRKNTLLE